MEALCVEMIADLGIVLGSGGTSAADVSLSGGYAGRLLPREARVRVAGYVWDVLR